MTRRPEEPATPFGKTLRGLRTDAGITGPEAARRVEISQVALSRYELGKRVPEPRVVRALCRLYEAPDEVRDQLVALADATHGGNVAADTVRKRGVWEMQQRVAKAEEAVDTITTWNSAFIDGDCQSRGYATALFEGSDLTAEDARRGIEARIQRQQLLRSHRRFRIIHTEGALMWCMGSPAVMVEQMDQLLDISHLPNVDIGVVPYTTPATIAPQHHFAIFGTSAVHIGTGHEVMFLTEPPHVKRYQGLWESFEKVANWGDDARATIKRVRSLFAAL